MSQPDSPVSLQACALRLARLTTTGAVAVGATNGYITNQFAKVTWKPEVEAGVEFTIRNACGGLAVTYKDRDIVKRYGLDLELMTPDPEIAELMIGATLITVAGASVGHQSPPLGINPNTYNYGVCLEVFTKALIGGTQAATNPWFHWVFPLSLWTVSDKNAENADMKVHYTGFCTENASIGTGPWTSPIAGTSGVNWTKAYSVVRDSTIPTISAAGSGTSSPGYISTLF